MVVRLSSRPSHRYAVGILNEAPELLVLKFAEEVEIYLNCERAARSN